MFVFAFELGLGLWLGVGSVEGGTLRLVARVRVRFIVKC